jgi:molybdenum cofactor cytidylyltransferase
VIRTNDSVGAVILAAGSSSRLGSPKQILRFREESLLRHSARAALDAGCRTVIVVTGANAELSRRELERLEVREVVNAEWQTGMASSVRAGVGALLGADPEATAAVLMVCDQPHVSAAVISGLIATRRATGRPIIASMYGGSFGVPALFSKPMFSELMALDGTAGAKQVIQRHASNARFVPFPGGAVDVDTADDFARLMSS